MYRVIKEFYDLQDAEHKYKVNDEFPRKGASVTDERVAVLASCKNKMGEPLIKAVKTKNKKTEE